MGVYMHACPLIDALGLSVLCIFLCMRVQNMPRSYPQVLLDFVVESAESNATATANLCAQVQSSYHQLTERALEYTYMCVQRKYGSTTQRQMTIHG